MFTLTYEFKLEPTPEQITYIEDTLDVCRSVWNFALAYRKDWVRSRKSPINACSIEREYIMSVDEPFPNYHRQAKQLTEAKKNNDFLKFANAQVLQQTLRTLDRAWDDMKNRGFGFPRFKNKYRMRSFVFPQLNKNPISDKGSPQADDRRGIKAVGQIVSENVCGNGLTGASGNASLVKNLRSRKTNLRELESPVKST